MYFQCIFNVFSMYFDVCDVCIFDVLQYVEKNKWFVIIRFSPALIVWQVE